MKSGATIKEKLTFVASAIVVVAAFTIMFPGLLAVAAGLWRILLIVAIAGGACLALAYGTRGMSRSKRPNAAVTQDPDPGSL